jgi:hypothetical protein
MLETTLTATLARTSRIDSTLIARAPKTLSQSVAGATYDATCSHHAHYVLVTLAACPFRRDHRPPEVGPRHLRATITARTPVTKTW